MTKNKMPIIIAVVLVAGLAGAYMSGMIGGGKDPNAGKKYVVPSIALAEPFTVNTSDPDGETFLRIGIAVQLEPMEKLYWDNFSGANAGGHGGGGGAMPGETKLSTYPKFRNAVIETAAHFSGQELRSEAGKKEFKAELMEQFAKIAEVDEAAHKAAPEDPTHAGVDPPYHVQQIDFTEFAVQGPA